MQNFVCFAKKWQQEAISRANNFLHLPKFSLVTKLQRCHQESLEAYNFLSGNKTLCSLTRTSMYLLMSGHLISET